MKFASIAELEYSKFAEVTIELLQQVITQVQESMQIRLNFIFVSFAVISEHLSSLDQQSFSSLFSD